MPNSKHPKWTLEELIQESKKYKTISEWAKLGKGSYSAASKNRWLEELTAHMPRAIKPNGYWTKDRILEDAKKYRSRSAKRLFQNSFGFENQRVRWGLL